MAKGDHEKKSWSCSNNLLIEKKLLINATYCTQLDKLTQLATDNLKTSVLMNKSQSIACYIS